MKFAIGGCKLLLNLVWTLWIWKFVGNKCLFFVTNINREKNIVNIKAIFPVF